jgi:protein-S-isoprenylcysteine O-methyltransferase Ste14
MTIGSIVWIISVILQIVIRYPYRNGTRQKPDSQERLLLILLTVGGLVLPLIYIFTNWLSFADYDAPLWQTILGIVIVAAGLWLFWRAHKDLGENWSSTLEIHDSHQLVTNGIYQSIRHPMYAANWLMSLGQALLLANWIAGPAVIISFAFMYFLRVNKEEEMMIQQFGDSYKEYMTKTGRIIPKLG